MENFIKIKSLGEGSFGTVFLVREKKSGGKLVCVKVLRHIHIASNSPSNANGCSVWSMEAAIMKKLRHPNLIRLLASSKQLIVMDYCSGGDLRSHLRVASTRGRLTEETIWFWFVQLALALHHMHSLKVLHRDVKTANVFLSNEGFLVLGDLGIARELGTPAGGDAMATTVIGTPLYMAPEMFEGKSYTFSSDVWALGCVLYELCTGSPPFAGTSTPHLVRKICTGNYAPISTAFSPQLGHLVSKMLALQPEHRPTMDLLLREPPMRIHLERYAVDRLAAGSRGKCSNETEQNVLEEQLGRLGVLVKIRAEPSQSSAPNATPSTRRQGFDQPLKELDRAANDPHEMQLKAIREQARQEQLMFALRKLQEMRFHQVDGLPKVADAANPVSANGHSKDDINLPEIKRHSLDCQVEWKAPVNAERPSSSTVRGRKPSRATRDDMAFLGIPRPGVPLTAKAKAFAAKSPLCRDVRELRKLEATKAARRYREELDVRHGPKQSIVSLKPEKAVVADKETDKVILAAMTELQRFF